MKHILSVLVASVFSISSHAKSCTDLELKSVVKKQVTAELAGQDERTYDFAAAFQTDKRNPNSVLVKFYAKFQKPDIIVDDPHFGSSEEPNGVPARYVGEILTDRASCSVVTHKDYYGNAVAYRFQAFRVTPISGAW